MKRGGSYAPDFSTSFGGNPGITNTTDGCDATGADRGGNNLFGGRRRRRAGRKTRRQRAGGLPVMQAPRTGYAFTGDAVRPGIAVNQQLY